MNTETALKHARAMRPSQVAAASHLYATTEWELAYIDEQIDNPLLNVTEQTKLRNERQAGEAALAVLSEKFPHVKALADNVESPRNLSARAHRGLTSDQEHDKTSPGPVEAAGAPSRAPAETSPHRAPRPGPRAKARRASSRVARGTVRNATRSVSIVHQATGGWGDDVWTFILGGVGLSFLFLVLTNSKGLVNLASGASHLVNWIIDPHIDPLRPTTTGAKK